MRRPHEPRKAAETPSEVLAIVKRAYHVAANQDNSTLSFERARKTQYYKSEPSGVLNILRPGESAYVTDDVRLIVDKILPRIVKVFLSGDEVVKYEPTGPEDVEASEEATEYVNWWLSRPKNQGYEALTGWFKDALLNGVAWIKHWARDDVKIETLEKEGVTIEELIQLTDGSKENESYEILEQEPRMVTETVQTPGGPMVLQREVYDVTIRKISRSTKIEIVPVPMDELLIEQKAKNFNDSQYFAHDTFMGRAELLDMGYSWEAVNELPEFSVRYEESQEERERHKREDRGYGSGKEPTGFSDWYAQQVKVTDHWIYTDLEGIGHAQWYWVKTAGETVQFLLDFKPSSHPRDYFSMLVTTQMPHTIWAQTPTDWAVKYQNIRSMVIRSIMNSIYRTNNPRPMIAEALADQKKTYADVVSNELGAPIRMKQPGAVEWQKPHVLPPDTWNLLQMMDKERVESGMLPPSAGASGDPDLLQRSKTAFGEDIRDQNEQEPIDLIIMNYANISGVSNLFTALLKLFHNNPRDLPAKPRRNGQFLEVKPDAWNPDMDAVADVGPGVGNRRRWAMEMSAIAEWMEKLASFGYPISREQQKNIFDDRFRYTTKNPDRYVSDPEMLPPPEPPKPDPAELLAMAELEDKRNDRLQIEYKARDERASQVLESYKIANDAEENQIEWAKLQEQARENDITTQAKLIDRYAQEETERRGQDMRATVPRPNAPGPERVQ